MDINANPCILPDSKFIAAVEKEGLHYNKIVIKIVEESTIPL
jgi:D-alanine-D-alanine ligase-like ATP-grasp enzyme